MELELGKCVPLRKLEKEVEDHGVCRLGEKVLEAGYSALWIG